MSSALLVKGARRSLAQIRYVTPVPPGSAAGLVASVYAQTERDCGLLVPPIALHSPAPAALAAAWVMLRETLLAGGTAGRAEKEIVAAAVSAGNACPYCVTVHAAAARGLISGPVAAHIADGYIDAVPDPGLRDLAQWARGSSRPRPDLPVPAGSFPELAGVAVTFHYLNRMVSVFLPPSPLPPRLPSVMGGPFMRVLASAMLSPSPAAGAALDLLPEASLPAEFSWAAGEPRVAATLARAAAAIEEAGDRAVPPRVREFVLDRLNRWNGQPPGPSRAWADAAVGRLAPADRAAGRLALLTAIASYQVCPADIEELRPLADQELIGLTAWASMAAARRIGSRLREPAVGPVVGRRRRRGEAPAIDHGTPGDAWVLPRLAPCVVRQPRRQEGNDDDDDDRSTTRSRHPGRDRDRSVGRDPLL